MMTRETLQGYIKAQPFRPFRLYLVSGRTFNIRHPEMVKLLHGTLLVFKPAGNDYEDLTDEWDTVSLTLIESISHIEASVH